MKSPLNAIFFIFFSLTFSANAAIKSHSDFPFINKKKQLAQTVFISSDSSFYGRLYFITYRHSVKDTLCVLYHTKKVHLKPGLNKLSIIFSNSDSIKEFYQPYYEVLSRSENIAPGIYSTVVKLTDTFGINVHRNVLYQKVDSNLAGHSFIRTNVTESLNPGKRSWLASTRLDRAKSYTSGNALKNADKKIQKLAKDKGLTYIRAERNSKSYLYFYYNDWFAGQYIIEEQKPLKQQFTSEQNFTDASNMNALAVNDIDLHPSLFSQYKTFKKQRDEKKEVKGELSVCGYTANAQEPSSGVDNNYVEVRGRVEFPLGNLPLEVEGLYTTQDAQRKIKSSYLHVHYDVEKIKQETMQFISSYNQKYAETKSKGVGMQQVYSSAIGALEGQKQRLQQSVNQQMAQPDDLASNDRLAIDTPGNVVAGGQQKLSGVEGNAIKRKEEIEEKERKISELTKKIDHYRQLLDQNNNTNYFDSALAYGKTSQLNQDKISYKQLAKKSADLLPDGTAKKMITGLTNFDAGMFPKYASKYTMGGQMMKGVDLGYDFGFCEFGVTVGKTEYIGRDGGLDKYTCYSSKVSVPIADNHKIAFIYYGYSADRKFYQGDGMFSNMSVAAPTFFQPVHILSLNYSGQVSKYVIVNSEAATSLKDGQTSINLSDKGSMHFDVEGNIPWSSMQASLSYDKTGKYFENNTLPVLLKGTQQYKISTSMDVWHGLATVGVDYNYLAQDNLNYSSNNTKWGFSLKTHSKRYPSMSLAYKPYSTFRSFSDTFNIPQRPLFGSVFSSKLNYQFKRKDYSMRFSLLYNASKTVADTTAYGNRMLQGMATYTQKIFSGTALVGYTEQHGGNMNSTVPSKMEFINFSTTYTCNKILTVNAGQETGITDFGLCRFSVTGGMALTHKKKPVAVRFNLRAGTYKLQKDNNWSPLYGGNLELDYRFKSRLNKKEKY